MITAARTHSEALTKVPKQVSTLPDQQVASSTSRSEVRTILGYETSDFYYSGMAFRKDIPGPGKAWLRAEQAQKKRGRHHARVSRGKRRGRCAVT